MGDKSGKREAGSGKDRPGAEPRDPSQRDGSELPASRFSLPLTCQRCGFPVKSRAWGCKNPCPNCGTVYPLGDCED